MTTLIKSITLSLALIFTYSFSIAQTSIEKYFYSKGVYSLCQAAHTTNDYLDGSYNETRQYIDVSIKSRDNVFGATISTDIRVVKGLGGLYFSDLIILGDDDMVSPFDAFGMQAAFMVALYKAVGPETYNEIRESISTQFNTDIEQWTGKMWALLALNLDYYGYMMAGE